jgi:CheY-like chemotaxis protein
MNVADHESVARYAVHGVDTSRPSANFLVLVENDEDDFILFRRAMEKEEATAQLHWATTGKEALDFLSKLKRSEAGSVCVVIDVRLPCMDGFEFLSSVDRQIKGNGVKFAFLTGRTDPDTERRAYRAGADAFFIKPDSFDGLREIVRALHRLMAR